MSSKKLPISINVFPTLDFVELVQLDPKSGQLEKAVALPCQFDPLTRQVTDRDAFLQTIRDLYSLTRIPLNTPAVLVLPGFFTREIELPAEFKKDELRFALVSEAERFYLFKKSEPQIDWINLDSHRLLYAAFHKNEIEKYQKIFQELRIPLLAIELSYFALLRGLLATGAVQEEIDHNARWGLLTISDSSFFASIQEGGKIIRTTDAPLSMGGDEAQSVLQEIQQDVEAFLENELLNKLVIINNSAHRGISALAHTLNISAPVIFIEQNENTLGSRGATEGEYPCSLEGLGGIFYKQFNDTPELNFLPETSEDIVGILHYQKQAFLWLSVANGALFLLILIIWGSLYLITLSKDHEREELAKESSKISNSLDPARLTEIKRQKFIQSVIDKNVELNNFMIALGINIKGAIWLDKIEISAAGFEQPLYVKLEGGTIDKLDDVNKVATTLNAHIKNTSLEVSNAAQNTSTDGQSFFSWSIQNTNSSSATPPSTSNQGAMPAAPLPPPGGMH